MSVRTDETRDTRPVIAARPEDIPVVDIGPLLAGTPGARERVAAALHEACTGMGFVFFVNHGIDPGIVARTFEAARIFSRLPAGEKMKVRMNRHQCGWMPPNVSVHNDTFEMRRDAHRPQPSEAFKYTVDLDPSDPDYGAGKRFRGHNKWPDPAVAPGVREAFLDFLFTFEGVAKRLLPAISVSLGLEPGWFDPHFERSSSMGRIAWYPPIPPGNDAISGPGHTDLSFITLIPPATRPGLEILTPEGVWIEQPAIPEAILMNTGNTLRRWTNDFYKATPHRVRADTGETRYSNIFFLYPNVDAVMECVPTCCGPRNPAQYPPETFGEFHAAYAARNFAYAEEWE